MTPAILLARLAARADVAGPDADLLARFRHARDEAAFAELVRRHGPAVYRVCRRLVGPAAADDAFQATFLVLATRSNSVNAPGAVGGWLVGVAGRVARQMRAARLRRDRHETAFAADPGRPSSDTPVSLELAEQFRILDEELTRLPDRVRGPVVLCLLEGRTHDQAAADLGDSPRTVRRRLDEAKRLLRLRLERRGVVPAVAAALAAGAGEVATAVPVGLGSRTVVAVFDFLAGGSATTAVPAAIAKGVVTAMIARKLAVVLTAAAVGLTALGVGVGGAGDGPGPATAAKAANDAAQTPQPAKAAADSPKVYEHLTDNFAVTAPTADLAKAVGEAAERSRKELATVWLGKALSPWPMPCKLRVGVKAPPHSNWEGRSTLLFSSAPQYLAVESLEIELSGGAEVFKHQTHALASEVMRCVLATHFGRPIPRWAEEGLALLATPKESVGWTFLRQNLIAYSRIVQEDRNIRLRDLFTRSMFLTLDLMDNKGIRQLLPELQCYSVAEYLVGLKPSGGGRAGLLRFIELGMADEGRGWDKAAKDEYGFSSIEELEKAWLASLDPLPSESRLRKTDNFTVDAPTAELAKRFGEEAERQRREKAIEWLGAEMPEWPQRCPLKVTVSPGHTGGATTFTFGERNGVRSQEMKIFGDLKQLTTSVLPHEIMHTVLAHHFGRPLPRWADEGISLLAESSEEQKAHDLRCREILKQGRVIPLRHLFPMKEYPNDMVVLFAQGYSVCRFLLNYIPYPALGPDAEKLGDALAARRALLLFVKTGLDKNWNEAAKIYGYDTVDRLEDAWLASLQPPPPADGKWETVPPTAPPTPTASGFTVVGPSRPIIRAIESETLYQWRTAGKRWFAGDRLHEPRTGMSVSYQPDGNFNWSADVKYAAGKASVLHFEVAGPLDRVLERELPFVVTHAALADHLGEGLPAWAVHGLGQLAQVDRYQAKADLDCRDLLRKGKAVRLSALLAGGPTLFTETNGTQSQEHSVCRFLLTLKPDAELTRFVKVGMMLKDWNAAAKQVYDVADADALEAAWLKWMATPASRLTVPAAVTPPPPAPAGPPRIPPTPVGDAADPDRVGQIVIKGNTVTADRVILDRIKLYPGQVLEYPKLEEARTNLLRSGLFDADDPPTVTVVPRADGSRFQDIEVRVKDIPLTGEVNSNAGPKK